MRDFDYHFLGEFDLNSRSIGLIAGMSIPMFGLAVDDENSNYQLQVAQNEITAYVKQNPSQGYYECTTKSGDMLHIKAGDFQSGKIVVSVADPIQPAHCKAALNLAGAQPR